MAPKRTKPNPEDSAEEIAARSASAEAAAAVITAPVLGESPERAVARMAYESKVKLFELALTRPFHPNELKWKPQMVKNNRCLAICYLDARAVQDRLDDAVGVEGWRDDYQTLEDGSVVCRLTLMTPSGLFITKCDVGSPSEQPDHGDRLKAAFSDALKRAAVKFGVGRYIYRIPHQWVDYDPVKKQMARLPQLPAWALPKKETPQPPAQYAEPGEAAEPPTHAEKAAEKAAENPVEKEKPAAAATKEQVNKEMDETAESLARAKAAEEATGKRLKEFLVGRLKWWEDSVNGCETPGQLTELIAENLKDEPTQSKTRVWGYLQRCFKHFGWSWDADAKAVVAPSNAAVLY